MKIMSAYMSTDVLLKRLDKNHPTSFAFSIHLTFVLRAILADSPVVQKTNYLFTSVRTKPTASDCPDLVLRAGKCPRPRFINNFNVSPILVVIVKLEHFIFSNRALFGKQQTFADFCKRKQTFKLRLSVLFVVFINFTIYI